MLVSEFGLLSTGLQILDETLAFPQLLIAVAGSGPCTQPPLVTRGAPPGGANAGQAEPGSKNVAGQHLLEGCQCSSLDEVPSPRFSRCPALVSGMKQQCWAAVEKKA